MIAAAHVEGRLDADMLKKVRGGDKLFQIRIGDEVVDDQVNRKLHKIILTESVTSGQ